MPRNAAELQVPESPFLDSSLVQKALRGNLAESASEWFYTGESVGGREVQARVLWVPEEFVQPEQAAVNPSPKANKRERAREQTQSEEKDRDLARRLTVKVGIFAASGAILFGITGANESPVQLGNDVVVGAKTVAAPIKFLGKMVGKAAG